MCQTTKVIQKSKVGHDSRNSRDLEQLIPQDVIDYMLAKNKWPTKRREEDLDTCLRGNFFYNKTQLLGT